MTQDLLNLDEINADGCYEPGDGGGGKFVWERAAPKGGEDG